MTKGRVGEIWGAGWCWDTLTESGIGEGGMETIFTKISKIYSGRILVEFENID